MPANKTAVTANLTFIFFSPCPEVENRFTGGATPASV